MGLNRQIYEKVREILFNKYAYPIEQIEPQINFHLELAVDSLEMYELMAEFEKTFDIIISQDDIDKFRFQRQDITRVSEIKTITIQIAVDYIEKQIIIRDKIRNN